MYQIALARHLRPEGFGLFSEITAVALLASTVGSFGTGPLAVRELAGERRDRVTFPSLLALVAVSSAATAVAVAAIFAAIGDHVAAYAVAAASVPFTALLGVLVAPFVARDRFGVPSATRAGGSLLLAVLVGVGVWAGAPLLFFVAAFTVVEAARAAFVASRLGRWRRGAARGGVARRLGSLARSAFPYGVLAVVGIVHLRIDIVMVRWIAGAAEAGMYAGAARFSYAAAILPSLLLGVLFPRFVRLREEGRAGALFLTASKVLFWCGCGIGFVGVTLAPVAVAVFLGAEYDGSVLPLRILMATLAFTFLQSVTGTVLVSGRDLQRVISLALGVTVLNVVLNGALVPRHGAAGAAAATLVSEAASVAGYAWLACRQTGQPVGALVRSLVVPRLSRSERALLLHTADGATPLP